jgi:DnaK suppressor protein
MKMMNDEYKDIYKKLEDIKADILQRNSICEDVDVDGDEVDLIQGISIVETGKQLLQRDIDLLDKVNSALDKLKHGTYGICESCEEKILIKRLLISPYTELCISCKEELEREQKQHR